MLDAAAREGQLDIVRLLLRARPDLATEERALLAADHPETERLIREVARSDDVDAIVSGSEGPLSVTRVAPAHGGPPRKGSSRFYTTVRGITPPAWADIAEGDTVFAGPGEGILVFGAQTRWLRPDQPAVVLDVPEN